MKRIVLFFLVALPMLLHCQRVYFIRDDTGKIINAFVPLDSADQVDMRGVENVTINHYSDRRNLPGIDTVAVKTPLTIEVVKNAIECGGYDNVCRSLRGLCDHWYATAKQEGKTDEEAARITLEKLGKKITEVFGR